RTTGVGLDRDDGAVGRRHRQHLAVDGDRERELDRADLLVPDRLDRDRGDDRLQLLRLRLVVAEQRAAGEDRGGDERGRGADALPAIASRGLRQERHLAGSAPLAAGWTPRRLSLASTRRR